MENGIFDEVHEYFRVKFSETHFPRASYTPAEYEVEVTRGIEVIQETNFLLDRLKVFPLSLIHI